MRKITVTRNFRQNRTSFEDAKKFAFNFFKDQNDAGRRGFPSIPDLAKLGRLFHRSLFCGQSTTIAAFSP